MKAFISYSTKDKLVGANIKNTLTRFGIDVFLAHDDINVSEEWKERIIDELRKTDIFIPLLSIHFKESEWASSEVGVAYFRKILIIPLCIDTTIPFGFINHLQAKPIQKGNIPLNYLIKPIIDRYPERIIMAVIEELERAGGYRYAESVMELLVPHYGNFSREDIDKFVDACITNGQVWDASKCASKYLPQFMSLNKDKIRSDKFQELSNKIKWVENISS